MNQTNLTKSSRTDLERIDQMTDDEIDTTDIPPLDDAFFAAAQWRMPIKKASIALRCVGDDNAEAV